MMPCQGAHAQQQKQGSNEALVCQRASLDKLKLNAQALSDDTEELGEALRQCPGYQDEVLLWLGFYYRNQGDYDKASALKPMDSETTLSDRDGVFAEARAGQTNELLSRIDAETNGWHQDAEAQLVLSRALARLLKFERSRQAYDDYL
jgi:hypothetical protein